MIIDFQSGVVNRKAYGHIGCLVHENFNIRLPQPYSVSSEEWLGKTAQLQDIVKFTVTRVDLQKKDPYIEGNIVELRYLFIYTIFKVFN